MAKIVKFDSEARSAMLRGVDILANTVRLPRVRVRRRHFSWMIHI